MKNPRSRGGFVFRREAAAYFLPMLEARRTSSRSATAGRRDPSAAGAAGPGRMRLRVDVEMQHVALLAPGGAGGELGAVGHLDRDGVIVGMQYRASSSMSCGGDAAWLARDEFRLELRGSIQDGALADKHRSSAPIAALPRASLHWPPAGARHDRASSRHPGRTGAMNDTAGSAPSRLGRRPRAAAAPRPCRAAMQARAAQAAGALCHALPRPRHCGAGRAAGRRGRHAGRADRGAAHDRLRLLGRAHRADRPVFRRDGRGRRRCSRWPAPSRYYLVTTLGERIVADLRSARVRAISPRCRRRSSTRAQTGELTVAAHRRHHPDQVRGRRRRCRSRCATWCCSSAPRP